MSKPSVGGAIAKEVKQIQTEYLTIVDGRNDEDLAEGAMRQLIQIQIRLQHFWGKTQEILEEEIVY